MRRATGEWVAMVDADDLVAARSLRAVRRRRPRLPRHAARDRRSDRMAARRRRRRSTSSIASRDVTRGGSANRAASTVGRHFTDRFGHLDLMVRRDFLESTGATYPDGHVDVGGPHLLPHPAVLARRPAPGPGRAADLLLPARRLVAHGRGARGAGAHGVSGWSRPPAATRWPTCTAVGGRPTPGCRHAPIRRSRPQGRLRPRPPVLAGRRSRRRASATGGAAALVGQKALQWAGRWSDRDLRPAIAARHLASVGRARCDAELVGAVVVAGLRALSSLRRSISRSAVRCSRSSCSG